MKSLLVFALFIGFVPMNAFSQGVKITDRVMSVTVNTPDGKIEIKRNQNPNNSINPVYAKTSRKCPPFCIQPMEAAPGVKTVGELEVIQFLYSGGVVVDARTVEWFTRGTIPGSLSIPFTQITTRLNELGCKKDNKWDCSSAKQVALFCNGVWCGQSPTAIKAMIREGYPRSKILYFRSGMQGWEALGLTVVKGKLSGGGTSVEERNQFLDKTGAKFTKVELEAIIGEAIDEEAMNVTPSHLTGSATPLTAMSSASSCGVFPKVSWWGNLSHGSVTAFVNRKVNGNWDKYLSKWDKQLSFLLDVRSKGGTIVTPKGGPKLKGQSLTVYITQVRERIRVTKCLKLENI
jgi:rhodanese-related sulfurtransferase